jgi:hypothetical protein
VRRLLGTVVLALAAALAAAAPACAQDQLRGVQLHPLWDGVSPQGADRQVGIAAGGGTDVIRMDLSWASIEQTGRRRISWGYVRRMDRFMRNARRRGQKVIVSFWGTPCWASRAPDRLRQGCRGAWWDRGVTAYAPRSTRDFAHTAAWVARRWGDDMAAVELWNEPNHYYFLRGGDPVLSYSRMLRAAYRPVKRVAPQVVVLGGSLALSDGDFLSELYERGGIGGHYDAIAYHPYTNGRDPRASGTGDAKHSFIDGTLWLREIMAAHGDAGGELWITEVGASTCSGDAVCVSERTQARFVRDYLGVAAAWPFVRAVVIYSLRDDGSSATDPSGSYGLLRRDLRPKPAWNAFRSALRG